MSSAGKRQLSIRATSIPNGAYGLGVVADDDIHLVSVQANDNTGYGADLSSTTGDVIDRRQRVRWQRKLWPRGRGSRQCESRSASASDNSGFGANLATNGSFSLADGYFSQNTGGVGLTLAAIGSTTLERRGR